MSDYESSQAKRHLIVGLFVVVGVAAFAWLVFRFGDLPSAVSKLRAFDVYVQFPSAPGVQRDTPVRFCGYLVGRVTHVKPPKLLAEVHQGQRIGPEYYQTVVVMSIDRRYADIPVDSQIKLMSRGLGSSYIEIKVPRPDQDTASKAFLSSGTWVQGSTGVASELFPEQTQRKLEALVDDLGAFVRNANAIVGDPNTQRDVKTTLANLSEASKRTVQVLERADQTLGLAGKAVEEYRQLALAGKETMRNADVRIDQLAKAIVQTSGDLGQAASQMQELIEKVNDGDGTLGRLVNDGRFYEGLLETTDQLQVLIQEFTFILEKLDRKGLSGLWKGSKR